MRKPPQRKFTKEHPEFDEDALFKIAYSVMIQHLGAAHVADLKESHADNFESTIRWKLENRYCKNVRYVIRALRKFPDMAKAVVPKPMKDRGEFLEKPLLQIMLETYKQDFPKGDVERILSRPGGDQELIRNCEFERTRVQRAIRALRNDADSRKALLGF